jgi:hypothetical protein
MILRGLRRTRKSSDSLAVALCVRNAPVNCREKGVLRRGYYAACYEYVLSYLKINNFFLKGSSLQYRKAVPLPPFTRKEGQEL